MIATEIITRTELVALVTSAVTEALKANPTPQLLDQSEAARYCGLARSSWFRLRSEGKLPPPVAVAGTGLKWRRRDLDEWLARLKPRRGK